MRIPLPALSLPLRFSQGVSTLLIAALLVGASVGLSVTAYAALNGPGLGRTECPNEEPIIVPDVEYKPIAFGPWRPGECVTPVAIMMHNTASGTLDSNWEYFNSGSGGRNVNSHFILGTDGTVYQTVDFYKEKVEVAYTTGYVNNYSIAIEMVGPYIHSSKDDQPTEQYSSALNLVCNLMDMYNIPLGATEADWISSTESITDPDLNPGVYGHYQITASKEDPGQGWMADFREDLRAGNCGAAGPGSGAAGRLVPYDAYARPYSWPMTGTVRQDYGYTEEAQSLGARFPGFYPKGNPGTIFSIANHDEQPLDPGTAKYINPNIDINPLDNSSQARAVYATHAGWLTFADWAGPEKGYTIQIESDVEGDGQADMGTRYMRLEPPKDGFFAPDVPITRLIASNNSSTGATGSCTNGPEDGSGTREGDWENVNKWNEEILIGIAEAKKTENVDVPCNLVKAFMQTESGGVEIDPNVSGYHGLMQVADNSVPGGGSDCDWHVYDLYTTQGNVNCGVQEIARGYKACDNQWDAAMSRYLSGNCDKYRDVSDAFGTTPLEYSNIVMDLWKLLDSLGGGSTTTIPTLPQSNPTTENPEETESISPPPYVLEGEDMTIENEDDTEIAYDDSSASGGASMRLDGTSRIYETVFKKADQLMIRAKSVRNIACINQEEAKIQVSINNMPVSTEPVEIQGSIFTTYPISVEGLDGREHDLSIRLLNPGVLICNRSVWIDAIHYVITNPNTPTVETVSSVLIEAEDLADVSEGEDHAETQDTAREDELTSDGRYVAFTKNSKIEGEFELPEANYFTIRARADVCGGDGFEDSKIPILKISIDDEEFMTLGVGDDRWTDYSYKFLPGQSVANIPSVPSTPPSTSTPPSGSEPTDDDASSDDDTSGGGGQSGVQGITDRGGDVLQEVDVGAPGGDIAEDEDANEGTEDDEPDTYKITIEYVNDESDVLGCDMNVYVDVLTFEQFQVTQAVYSKVSMIGKTKYIAYNQLIGYVSSSRGSDVEFDAYVAELDNIPDESDNTENSPNIPIEPETPDAVTGPNPGGEVTDEMSAEEEEELKKKFYSLVPNANQIYLSYRIMYNNPNVTTFPLPIEPDKFINAEVDNPYIVETAENTVAGSLTTVFDEPNSPMFFFCALRQRGDNVKCIQEPNP